MLYLIDNSSGYMYQSFGLWSLKMVISLKSMPFLVSTNSHCHPPKVLFPVGHTPLLIISL